jgi:hypothetical protein
VSYPICYTSSSIGPAPGLPKNFLDRPETVSITWDDGFHFEGDDSFLRVFHQCEPPEVLNIVDKLIANHKYYDLIMAFDDHVLRECPNAVFLTESACTWLPRKWDTADPFGVMNWNGIRHKNPVEMKYEPCDVSKKDFAVSFLTSSKNMFPGHRLRQEIFEKLPNSVGDLRVWKHRSPPVINDKRDLLEPYMFSIVPENSEHNGYYTEKIVDCFIAKTVPLYWGCPDIGNHFNIDGILTFTSFGDLQRLLNNLSPEWYRDKSNAIEENFHTALKGVHQWDLIENYVSQAIQKKHQQGSQRQDSIAQVSHKYGRLYRPLRKAL